MSQPARGSARGHQSSLPQCPTASLRGCRSACELHICAAISTPDQGSKRRCCRELGALAYLKKFWRARMRVQVKAAEVMASVVENSGRAAFTEPARALSSNCARNSGSVPAQSFTFGAEPGGSNSSRMTRRVCSKVMNTQTSGDAAAHLLTLV